MVVLKSDPLVCSSIVGNLKSHSSASFEVAAIDREREREGSEVLLADDPRIYRNKKWAIRYGLRVEWSVSMKLWVEDEILAPLITAERFILNCLPVCLLPESGQKSRGGEEEEKTLLILSRKIREKERQTEERLFCWLGDRWSDSSTIALDTVWRREEDDEDCMRLSSCSVSTAIYFERGYFSIFFKAQG